MFCAIEDALGVIYPSNYFSGGTASISLLERDESETDGQNAVSENRRSQLSPDVFSARLRKYQEERRQESRASARVPQGDDISVPFQDERSNSSQSASVPLNGSVSALLSTVKEDAPVDAPEGQPEMEEATVDREGTADQQERISMKTTNTSFSTDKVKERRAKATMPTSIRFDEEDARAVLSTLSMNQSDKLLDVSKKKTRQDRKRNEEKKRLVQTPQMVESWDDEEAQHTQTKYHQVYNTDPAKYDENHVVYERELIIVPKKEPSDVSPGATSRNIIRRILLALFLVVPVTVGAYLTFRK